MARPEAEEVQLDVIRDYRSNVARYPAFQEYFRRAPTAPFSDLGRERSAPLAAWCRSLQT